MRRGLIGFFAVVAAVAGAVLTFVALIRLGWRRHGVPATDLGFLHAEWLGSLARHPAHRANLITLGVGVALMIVAAVGILMIVRRRS